MSPSMVRLLAWILLGVAWAMSARVEARSATARIARISTPVAVLEQVRVRLDWPAGARQGELRIEVGGLHAPDLGYRFANIGWRCPLRRETGGWSCAGTLRAPGSAPFRFSLRLDDRQTRAVLMRGGARAQLDRVAATPDLTRIDLAQVPLAWTEALLAKAWDAGRTTGGTIDATLAVDTSSGEALRITGPLALRSAGFDTPDGQLAAENLGARLDVDARLGPVDDVVLSGSVQGGELLFGRTYVSLANRTVPIHLRAHKRAGEGWRFPELVWRDEGVLVARGQAALTADAGLESMDVALRSDRLDALGEHYLSGWLGAAGLGELQLRGAAQAQLRTDVHGLEAASLTLDRAGLSDPRGRFAFDRLDGDLRFSAREQVSSELRWRAGSLYGVDFGAARLPWTSSAGVMRLREELAIPLLGGTARFQGLQLRPPSGSERFDVRFGLALERLDVQRLAESMGWPAFGGELSGRIPQAHYRNDRLTFDGGLAMQLFDGRVEVSSLAMERPFGTAPTLSADVALDDLDLEALTGVFGFGAITGRLDGEVAGLRLVDWQPVAFDARLQTDRKRGVRQRISQRAVQDLSSVGDASLMTSLQSQLIGLFDDFGYSRIGVSCRLIDEVCTMDGLGSAQRGFIIVEGSGLPRLSVVGFNRRVDWPMLVERLAAVGKGDVRPVVD